nr:hypothetical protein Itr_chr09CG15260 [Ipomoea trifida]
MAGCSSKRQPEMVRWPQLATSLLEKAMKCSSPETPATVAAGEVADGRRRSWESYVFSGDLRIQADGRLLCRCGSLHRRSGRRQETRR